MSQGRPFSCSVFIFSLYLQATELGVLDTNHGQYINIETGQSMTMNEAIERDLVLVERGMVKREDRDRKVSSLHIDEEEEEVGCSLHLGISFLFSITVASSFHCHNISGQTTPYICV